MFASKKDMAGATSHYDIASPNGKSELQALAEIDLGFEKLEISDFEDEDEMNEEKEEIERELHVARFKAMSLDLKALEVNAMDPDKVDLRGIMIEILTLPGSERTHVIERIDGARLKILLQSLSKGERGRVLQILFPTEPFKGNADEDFRMYRLFKGEKKKEKKVEKRKPNRRNNVFVLSDTEEEEDLEKIPHSLLERVEHAPFIQQVRKLMYAYGGSSHPSKYGALMITDHIKDYVRSFISYQRKWTIEEMKMLFPKLYKCYERSSKCRDFADAAITESADAPPERVEEVDEIGEDKERAEKVENLAQAEYSIDILPAVSFRIHVPEYEGTIGWSMRVDEQDVRTKEMETEEYFGFKSCRDQSIMGQKNTRRRVFVKWLDVKTDLNSQCTKFLNFIMCERISCIMQLTALRRHFAKDEPLSESMAECFEFESAIKRLNELNPPPDAKEILKNYVPPGRRRKSRSKSEAPRRRKSSAKGRSQSTPRGKKKTSKARGKSMPRIPKKLAPRPNVNLPVPTSNASESIPDVKTDPELTSLPRRDLPDASTMMSVEETGAKMEIDTLALPEPELPAPELPPLDPEFELPDPMEEKGFHNVIDLPDVMLPEKAPEKNSSRILNVIPEDFKFVAKTDDKSKSVQLEENLELRIPMYQVVAKPPHVETNSMVEKHAEIDDQLQNKKLGFEVTEKDIQNADRNRKPPDVENDFTGANKYLSDEEDVQTVASGKSALPELKASLDAMKESMASKIEQEVEANDNLDAELSGKVDQGPGNVAEKKASETHVNVGDEGIPIIDAANNSKKSDESAFGPRAKVPREPKPDSNAAQKKALETHVNTGIKAIQMKDATDSSMQIEVNETREKATESHSMDTSEFAPMEIESEKQPVEKSIAIASSGDDDLQDKVIEKEESIEKNPESCELETVSKVEPKNEVTTTSPAVADQAENMELEDKVVEPENTGIQQTDNSVVKEIPTADENTEMEITSKKESKEDMPVVEKQPKKQEKEKAKKRGRRKGSKNKVAKKKAAPKKKKAASRAKAKSVQKPKKRGKSVAPATKRARRGKSVARKKKTQPKSKPKQKSKVKRAPKKSKPKPKPKPKPKAKAKSKPKPKPKKTQQKRTTTRSRRRARDLYTPLEDPTKILRKERKKRKKKQPEEKVVEALLKSRKGSEDKQDSVVNKVLPDSLKEKRNSKEDSAITPKAQLEAEKKLQSTSESQASVKIPAVSESKANPNQSAEQSGKEMGLELEENREQTKFQSTSESEASVTIPAVSESKANPSEMKEQSKQKDARKLPAVLSNLFEVPSPASASKRVLPKGIVDAESLPAVIEAQKEPTSPEKKVLPKGIDELHNIDTSTAQKHTQEDVLSDMEDCEDLVDALPSSRKRASSSPLHALSPPATPPHAPLSPRPKPPPKTPPPPVLDPESLRADTNLEPAETSQLKDKSTSERANAVEPDEDSSGKKSILSEKVDGKLPQKTNAVDIEKPPQKKAGQKRKRKETAKSLQEPKRKRLRSRSKKARGKQKEKGKKREKKNNKTRKTTPKPRKTTPKPRKPRSKSARKTPTPKKEYEYVRRAQSEFRQQSERVRDQRRRNSRYSFRKNIKPMRDLFNEDRYLEDVVCHQEHVDQKVVKPVGSSKKEEKSADEADVNRSEASKNKRVSREKAKESTRAEVQSQKQELLSAAEEVEPLKLDTLQDFGLPDEVEDGFAPMVSEEDSWEDQPGSEGRSVSRLPPKNRKSDRHPPRSVSRLPERVGNKRPRSRARSPPRKKKKPAADPVTIAEESVRSQRARRMKNASPRLLSPVLPALDAPLPSLKRKLNETDESALPSPKRRKVTGFYDIHFTVSDSFLKKGEISLQDFSRIFKNMMSKNAKCKINARAKEIIFIDQRHNHDHLQELRITFPYLVPGLEQFKSVDIASVCTITRSLTRNSLEDFDEILSILEKRIDENESCRYLNKEEHIDECYYEKFKGPRFQEIRKKVRDGLNGKSRDVYSTFLDFFEDVRNLFFRQFWYFHSSHESYERAKDVWEEFVAIIKQPRFETTYGDDSQCIFSSDALQTVSKGTALLWELLLKPELALFDGDEEIEGSLTNVWQQVRKGELEMVRENAHEIETKLITSFDAFFYVTWVEQDEEDFERRKKYADRVYRKFGKDVINQ